MMYPLQSSVSTSKPPKASNVRAGTKHIVEATSQSPRAVYSSHEEKPLLEHHVLAVLDFIHFYYIYIYIYIYPTCRAR